MSERNDSADQHHAGDVHPAHGADWLHTVLRHTLHVVLAIGLIVYFITAGLYVGLRYIVLPHADAFRPRIEALVSEKIHAQLSIGKLTPHWTGYQPGLDIENVTIRDRNGQLALQIPHAVATVSWQSLVRFTPLLSSLIVDRPDVLIERDSGGGLSVAGVPVPTRHTGNDTLSTWLLRQQAIVLRGGTLRWRDAQHDAPELALSNIRLAMLNDGTEHQAALQAPADGTLLHGPLDFRASFRHTTLTAIGKPVNWTGEAYVSTGPVDLPTLAHYVNFPISTYQGRIDNAIWFDFTEGRITSATGTLAGTDVLLQVHPTQPKLDIPVANFDWTMAVNGDDYALQLRDLHAEMGQPPLDDGTPVSRTLALSTLSAQYRKPSVQHGQSMSITGDRIDLGLLAEFSRALPLPRRFLNALVRFNPRGTVANYTIALERAKPDAGEAATEQRSSVVEPVIHYRFKADLQGISVAAQEPPPGLTPLGHPRAGIPGFENVWGHVDADESHGSIALDTANAAVTIPGVFDNPRLTFDRMIGHGTWTIAPTVAAGERHKAFDVQVSDFSVANADTNAKLTASYSNAGHGRGSLDLKAQFARAQVAHIARYLPTSISEKLRIYLGHGLQSGVSRNATIEIHGNLDKFPYSRDPTAGVFHIVAPFRGGRFDPSPFPPRNMRNGAPSVWPAFDDIDGAFELKENKLRFDIDHARYKRVTATKVDGRIEDLGTKASPLVIDGAAHGPLADMLDYANQSSLGYMTKHEGDKVKADGSSALALKLTIPRYPKPHIGVEGALTFQRDRLAADNVPPLSQLTGKVAFTEHTVALNGLAGQFLGGDIRANGGLKQDGTYAFDVGGNIAVDTARDSLNLHGTPAEVLKRVSGSAPYSLAVRGAKGHIPAISASSDMTGLALDFPAPFDKPVGTAMPLRFSLAPTDNPAVAGEQRADLRFGPIVGTYLLTHQPGEPAKVLRGAVGVNKPADLPTEGVTAAVDLPTLDADAWRTVFTQMHNTVDTAQSSVSPGTAMQYVPDRLAVHIGTLTLLKRQWESVVVGASREANNGWQANIGSNQMSGHVSWQPGATKDSPGMLQARLARLVVPSTSRNDLLGQAISQPAKNVPSIDLIVNELIVRDHNLGRLEVDAHNFDEDGVPVWQLDKLDLSNPAATLTATGNWRTSTKLGANVDEDTARRTVFDFKLDVKDAGALLERAGQPRTLKNGSGTLSGKIGWRGGPTAIDYPTLGGNLALDLRHGQILKVDPGVAKLLGVISLQSLARFATLNFKDVIGEGLPFERVTGSAQIDNGIARTDNFQLVTAPARADMSGTVDLAHETQDLHVHITPTVSAGAAVVAATVINPFLGLGALVADFALSHGISSAFARDYAINGSWAKPHVERVRDDRGKMDHQQPAPEPGPEQVPAAAH
ncbi:YhdP family protein [Paraburkholderia phosphatilytica]|uniref:YhdP family phospholipid transporter n=1 Tax=Paraburkholderia phosphatilytica TaxID=2282883 RepID=UPI000E4D1FBB|nr:AsmA-like C-terminal region-containing protein [Paraburkholderia phosphatilytica]